MACSDIPSLCNLLPFRVKQEQGVDKLRRYGPGGYHLTHIDDRHFDGRYEIIHKLGHGSYSTVWLARDRWDARYVAMKIFTADISESCSEGNILRVLNSGSPKLLAHAFVPLLLNEFMITGPNGRHRCIVSDVAGPSFAQWRESENIWKFPVNVARSIAAQIIWGLAYIQSRGVVHSVPNDLKLPRYCVPPAGMYQSSKYSIRGARIIISDFGEAFFKDKPPKELHTPALLLPPEYIFHEPISQANALLRGMLSYEPSERIIKIGAIGSE
ncbi:uncharacterized protein ASPGLDRAFT_66241 [Aspergillus glaucus CBS 516.65]|uniref:non-specific serine/threonine protein kinase n=1 Tax=Aspergillus glaucus CBS 516.65 TaxID=1160497 RepID=A0A1L9VLB3_ASPGL|nr:hypothetical protein ASPGLDRAFT_66241 [Aspergillus glaucus CBS 516.65]OJJ84716.1 hypothetical protein ASPGLDRAFT_66241 [Aspergillus glaucus CBS 516.65]